MTPKHARRLAELAGLALALAVTLLPGCADDLPTEAEDTARGYRELAISRAKSRADAEQMQQIEANFAKALEQMNSDEAQGLDPMRKWKTEDGRFYEPPVGEPR